MVVVSTDFDVVTDPFYAAVTEGNIQPPRMHTARARLAIHGRFGGLASHTKFCQRDFAPHLLLHRRAADVVIGQKDVYFAFHFPYVPTLTILLHPHPVYHSLRRMSMDIRAATRAIHRSAR